MRGRAIGAQAVYISDPASAPEGVAVWPIGAFYLDGTADAEGRFWGMRMEFTYEEAELISAALPDDAGCIEPAAEGAAGHRSEEHTSELQSLMRISYAVFCLNKKQKLKNYTDIYHQHRDTS